MFLRQKPNSSFISLEHTLIVVSLLLQSVLSIGTGCVASSSSQSRQNVTNLPYLPDAFHVTIEINDIVKRETVIQQLYFDNPGNRATTITMELGQEKKQIYNYDMDEIYSIENGECNSTQLSTSGLIGSFGLTLSDGKIHINDSQSVLTFGKRYGEVYIGPTTVDGISVNHWRSCHEISPIDPNIKNATWDYYFSSNWSTPSTIQSEPVMVEFWGTRTSRDTVTDVHTISRFSNYVPDVDDVDDTIFQTPPNVVCPGRKQSKPLPQLPDGFYFKTEIIYPDLSAINFEDTWYDKTFKLFRKDYHPLLARYPTYSTNPMSEIHDYNTGVRYIIDQSLGNCTTLPLSTNLEDTALNLTAFKYDKSFILDMKTPIQFFNLNLNYTYTGQLHTRDVLCDVYQAVSRNFTVDNFDNNQRVIITVYFLAQEWTNIFDDDAQRSTTSIPVKMELFAPDVGFTLSYNFMDFDPQRPSITAFDFSKCFDKANKLSFQLKFPGTITQDAENSVKEWTHILLAETMHVSLLRIAHLTLASDEANLFISATLLDQTTYKAQFTHIQGKVNEDSDDATLLNSTGSDECASYCVNSPVLTCNSFDYCNNDKTCRLSTKHTSDGVVLQNIPSCDHYSRNVDGFPAQTTIANAYKALRRAVFSNNLKISNVGPRTYTAVDVVITFGWMNPSINLSNMLSASTAYSYTMEVSIPAQDHVYISKVWYDDGFQLLRYDPHYNKIVPPYFTTRPLSIIEDFNTGVKYVIDKTYRSCEMTNIEANDYGVISPSNTTAGATYSVTLRDPLQMFRIDSSYFFVGQQTIRGMTCNIFESLRTDYPSLNGTVNAIYRYAFLADGWMEISDGYMGGSAGQPIRLEITVLKTAEYIVYNIFDFDTDHPDSSLFDIHLCFSANQTKQFQITFPGHYIEFLNTTSKMFIIEAIFMMANRSGASTVRFQRTRIDHDDQNIYLTSSLIAQPDRLRFFTYVRNGFEPARVDQVVTGLQTPTQCAAKCFDNSKLRCKSFYLCTQSSQCLLSSDNVLISATGQPHELIKGCQAYSRTSDISAAEPNNDVAFRHLANAVFAGKLQMMIPLPKTAINKIVKATYIKDTFLSNEQHDPQDFSLLSFTLYKTRVSLDGVVPINNVDINECAQTCISNTETSCTGFSYCTGTNDICLLSRIHPDQMDTSKLTPNVNCTTYNRNYVSEYKKLHGMISQTISDIPYSAVESDEICAQTCSKSGACRMFQYCPSTKQCVMYNERQFAAQSNDSSTTCNVYISPYDKDFVAVNAGTYKFISTVVIHSVSKANCVRYCIYQQNNNCAGFYYSSKVQSCYLPGKYGKVIPSINSSDVFCDQYNRTHFPILTFPSGYQLPTAGSPTVQVSSTTSTAGKTTSSTGMTTSTTGMTTSSYTVGLSTSQPCSNLQYQTGSKPNNNTGMVAGVAIGTFLLGLLLGAIGFYVFGRFRNLDKDELKTNFVEHEEM